MELSLFSKYAVPPPVVTSSEKKLTRPSERGDLLDYFVDHLNVKQRSLGKREYSVKFIAIKVGHLTTQDLYYIKSRCNDDNNWYAAFWSLIKTVDKDVD